MRLPVSFFSFCFSFIQFHKVQSVPVKPLGHSRRSSWRWADEHEHYLDALFCEVAVFKSGCLNLPVVFAFELTSVGEKKDYVNCNSARLHPVARTNMYSDGCSTFAVLHQSYPQHSTCKKYTGCKYTNQRPKNPEKVFKIFIETLDIMTVLKENHRPKWPVFTITKCHEVVC